MEVASRLQVPSLQQAAVERLISSVDASNCLQLWAIAGRLALPELAAAATATALTRFDQLGGSIGVATAEQLTALL